MKINYRRRGSGADIRRIWPTQPADVENRTLSYPDFPRPRFPRQTNRDQIFFGATVTYADARGAEHTVTIVGIDEANLEAGLVSWISPIARALLKAREGDAVKIRTPTGEESIEVLEISYPEKKR